jgi:hypothetical protein
MFGRRRTGFIAATGCVIAVTAGVFGAVTAAQTADRPVITGDPVVGNVLTASASPTGQAVYLWQACNPSIANCADSPDKADPNWFAISLQSHNAQTYTVAPSDAGNFIRVVVQDNNRGNNWTTSAPVGPVPKPPVPPGATAQQGTIEPEHGISLLVEPTGGTPLIKPKGQSNFAPLTGLEKIPVGSVLDTRGSKARVTAATGNLGDTTEDNSLELFGGITKLKQAGLTNSPMIAKLIQKLSCPSSAGASAAASKSSDPIATESRRRSRRVWGSGSGSYGTSGSGGTGSVRGTLWLTKDTCGGTFFKVPAAQPTPGPHGISVYDKDLKKNVLLGPGQSYFARNR